MARRRRRTWLGVNRVDWALALLAALMVVFCGYLFAVGVFSIGGQP